MRIWTTRPSGSVASRWIGVRRLMGRPLQEDRTGKHGKPRYSMDIDRTVHFRPRTIFGILGILLAVAVVLYVLYVARHVLSWLLIALFLALALNPAVQWLERRGLTRGLAAGITFLAAIAVIVGFGFLFIPTLVDQVNAFANQVPDYVRGRSQGRGRFGFLETKYHVVERVKD